MEIRREVARPVALVDRVDVLFEQPTCLQCIQCYRSRRRQAGVSLCRRTRDGYNEKREEPTRRETRRCHTSLKENVSEMLTGDTAIGDSDGPTDL